MSEKSLGHNEEFEDFEKGVKEIAVEEYPPLSEYEKQLFKYEGRTVLGVNVDVTSLTIPDYFDSIGVGAFKKMENLKSVSFGKNIKTIGEYAFYYAGLTEVRFPNALEEIGDSAFSGLDITTLNIPDSVRKIGQEAFRFCNKLTALKLGNGVEIIGDRAFSGCQRLASVELGNGAGIIGNQAFFACQQLASVELGNGVEIIGNQAFFDCRQLASVNIPDSVTRMGSDVFGGWKRRFSTDHETMRSTEFWETFGPEVTIGNGLKTIKKDNFSYISNSEIIIPDGVEAVESGAFCTRSNIMVLIIGKDVKSISGICISKCPERLDIRKIDSINDKPDKMLLKPLCIINRSKFLSGKLEEIFNVNSNAIFDTSAHVDDPTRCPVCAGEYKKRLFAGSKCRLC